MVPEAWSWGRGRGGGGVELAGVVGEELGNGDFPTRAIKIKGEK